MISRRESLKVFASGAAVGLTGAVIVATTSCVADPAPAAKSSIEDMYAEWRVLLDRDYSGETEEESNRIHAVFLDLQERIIQAEPRTPRDVALQFWCDTHCGASDWSDLFFDQMHALVERRAS